MAGQQQLGPAHRLGILVPASNSNAETSSSRMLEAQHDIGVHYSRFRLPADLDREIDRGVLGEAPGLLADAEPEAVAFHGTSGSWKGIQADRALADELSEVVAAPSTTATLAVVEALAAFDVSRLGLVFPGPDSIAGQIVDEFGRNDLDIHHYVVPDRELTNVQIASLSIRDIEDFALPLFDENVELVVCIGTNLRSTYLVDSWEDRFGVPVIDSSCATLWHLMRLAGISRPIDGWGRLLALENRS